MGISAKIRKDKFKRFLIDRSRKIGRLKTPMDMVLLWLKTNGYLKSRLIALEPFGMHGLWHTKDYSPLCDYNEIFEIEKTYFNFLKKSYPQFNCRNEDSIAAIKNKQLHKNAYNFIVVDNPYGGIYGDNYCEHFDFINDVIPYLADNSVLVLNIVLGDKFAPDVAERRKTFYGKTEIQPKEALSFYSDMVRQSGKSVKDFVFIPRNDIIGYVVIVIGNNS